MKRNRITKYAISAFLIFSLTGLSACSYTDQQTYVTQAPESGSQTGQTGQTEQTEQAETNQTQKVQTKKGKTKKAKKKYCIGLLVVLRPTITSILNVPEFESVYLDGREVTYLCMDDQGNPDDECAIVYTAIQKGKHTLTVKMEDEDPVSVNFKLKNDNLCDMYGDKTSAQSLETCAMHYFRYDYSNFGRTSELSWCSCKIRDNIGDYEDIINEMVE